VLIKYYKQQGERKADHCEALRITANDNASLRSFVCYKYRPQVLAAWDAYFGRVKGIWLHPT